MQSSCFSDFTLIDAKHPLHRQKVDIFIEDGLIEKIEKTKEPKQSDHRHVSIGWADSFCANPVGYEYQNDFDTLTKSAVAGGFTDIGLLPSSQPPVETIDALSLVKNKADKFPVDFHVFASPTYRKASNQMTDILDLAHTGAIGFVQQNIPTNTLLLQLLQYIGASKKPFIAFPNYELLNDRKGDIHEGYQSIYYGLTGMPSSAETISLKTCIDLVAYSNCPIHISHLSTASSVELIRKAKQEGLPITCDVAGHQLIFSERNVTNYDTNFKVLPPLRTDEDKQALWKGIADDTIDAIVSSHQPQHPDYKEVPFKEAKFGISTLETLFASLNTHKPIYVSLEKIVEKLTQLSRVWFEKPTTLEQGQKASLTFFDPEKKWTFERAHTNSVCKNTPFYNCELKGKVLGIAN